MKKATLKKILSLVFALSLCFAMSVVSYASTPHNNFSDDVYLIQVTNSSIMPTSVTELLQIPVITINGTQSFEVTPDRGTNIKICLYCEGASVTVKVKKKTSLFYAKTFEVIQMSL